MQKTSHPKTAKNSTGSKKEYIELKRFNTTNENSKGW